MEASMYPVWNEIPNYSEIAPEPYDGEKVSIDSLLNQEVAILKFKETPSSFFEGNYMQIQVKTADDQLKWFFTSSQVLAKQLKELEQKGNLPIRAKIVKIKRYYSLTR